MMMLLDRTKRFLYHLHTAYLFSVNDLEVAVFTGFVFGTVNSLTDPPLLQLEKPLRMSRILTRAPVMLLWSWCALLLHNLQNQRHAPSIAEDRLNKPWRPLPSGRLSPDQAAKAMYCLYPVNLVISYMAGGGLIPFVFIALFSIWHNELGGASDGFLKNLHSACGLVGFLVGPLEITAGRSVFSGNGHALAWLTILGAAMFTTIHAQDFRDVEGDEAAGRRTVPLVIGDTRARILVSVGVIVWTIVSIWFWRVEWTSMIWPTCLGLLLILNMFRDKTDHGNAQSYRLWALWTLGLMFLPVIRTVFG